MGRLVVVVAALLVAGLVAPAAAADGKRVALVIGNSAYRAVPGLPNPANDATDVAASLTRLGFSVTLMTNASFDDMRRGLIAFGRDAAGAGIAAVFYAGHGLEIGGENWLVPVDADLKRDADVEAEAVSLRNVMLQVSNTTSLGLVILDACRNNPFAAKMQRAIATRAVERGLSRIEPSGNVLVAYSARDGTTALDGDGRNSPFTTALLHNLETPGLEITFMFRNVRDDVMEATKNEQQPFVYGSLSRKAIYLASQPSTADQAQSDEASRVWLTIRDTESPAVLDDFVRRYASTPYGGLARARLDELRQKQANAAPTASPAPIPPAIDPALVGTWEIMVPSDRGVARWIWQMLPDGTYRFHSVGPRAAPAHQGTMSASNGHWSLRALKGLPGYDDGGSYEIRDDTAVIAGKLGTGYWKRSQAAR
jgi:uncharacterized caspase-like protein